MLCIVVVRSQHKTRLKCMFSFHSKLSFVLELFAHIVSHTKKRVFQLSANDTEIWNSPLVPQGTHIKQTILRNCGLSIYPCPKPIAKIFCAIEDWKASKALGNTHYCVLPLPQRRFSVVRWRARKVRLEPKPNVLFLLKKCVSEIKNKEDALWLKA